MFKYFLYLSLMFFSALCAKTTYLFQKDFDQGTYLIDQPGTYILAEEITFNPQHGRKPYEVAQVSPSQLKSNGGKYDDQAFGLGFFAAIVIQASDVTLDLNQKTIQQSKEHALLQRFFSVIELANVPFIPGEGPHHFGAKIVSASKVLIKNGKIGRSSHQGIHGNGNRFISIEDVDFEDFEVAAVSLNGVDGLRIKNCTAKSREDVPVLGIFATTQFILPYLDYLVESGSQTTLRVDGKEISPIEMRNKLRQAILNVHEDLIVKNKPTIDKFAHPEEYELFHNAAGVIDGNCYGFLVNFYGQAVGGFPIYHQIPEDKRAKNITIQNTHVKRLKGKINEIVAINHENDALVDPLNAIFQIHNTHPDTKENLSILIDADGNFLYKGNMASNAQALVAKALKNGDFKQSKLDLSRSNITPEVIDWIESGTHSTQKLTFICNSDSQFHLNKGVIGFKIDGAYQATLDNTTAENIINLSERGSSLCGMYTKSNPSATLDGCGGPRTRGYSIAGSNHVSLRNCSASHLVALCGTATGFDIINDSSNVLLQNCAVTDVLAGEKFERNHAPNEPPMAIGFRIGPSAHDIALIGVHASKMKGFSGEEIVLDESSRAQLK
ncbi:hypothetical protein [Waddlia chondrophila]|uniref:Right handed beta helix domain-containing protein n=1 Tax=Waddlia chondrophila (strain ATCC VR-1470 / WSU 86-1044) TaxID=716544 RepID=D6YW31_WADCW|nr:hypothetical protein [Waddlia chondrophila]ADI38342.1 hypothetical protein wcw_0982 [Waddlia chondrophila WSU 86-1044]